MQPGNPFILCPCRGKKRKIGQIFPPLCPDFVCFLALLFFGCFFFFKNASCFNFPPQISKPLRSLLRLRASLRWRGSLLFSLSLTLSVSLADRLPHRLHRTGPLSACDVTHTQADTLIEMSYLLSRQDYMHIAILFREQDDTQLQTR